MGQNHPSQPGSVSQLAEERDLKSPQCEFESHRSHHGCILQLVERTSSNLVKWQFESACTYHKQVSYNGLLCLPSKQRMRVRFSQLAPAPLAQLVEAFALGAKCSQFESEAGYQSVSSSWLGNRPLTAIIPVRVWVRIPLSLAQWLERPPYKWEVLCSNQRGETKRGHMFQGGENPLRGYCVEFDSLCLHQYVALAQR